MMETRMNTPRILIADDEPKNIRLITALLKTQGYLFETAANGVEAVEKAGVFNPDLIMLDIMMPEMDGYEACAMLKQNPATRRIPVVMVTSLADRESKLRSLEAGADDFLSKPVDSSELLVRCRNLLKMKEFMDAVVEKNRQLEELQELKKNLTDMIVHDLKSPLTGIMGNIGLAAMLHDAGEHDDLGKYLAQAEEGCNSLRDMLRTMLDIGSLEDGVMPLESRRIGIEDIFRKVVMTYSAVAHREGKEIMIEAHPPVGIHADPDLIERVLQNLVSNALRHVDRDKGKIILSVGSADGKAVVSVSDNGEGIPAEYHGRIFDKFARVSKNLQRTAMNKGLGLTFCKLAVEAHGGEIRVESVPGEGSRFLFTIPQGRE